MEQKIVKCIVACTNANGEPDLQFVQISGNEEQFNAGKHYELASQEAALAGYDPVLVYDENDAAGKAMASLFVWSSAPVVSMPCRAPLTDEELFPLLDWKSDVRNGDTKLGYNEWVKHNVESMSPQALASMRKGDL